MSRPSAAQGGLNEQRSLEALLDETQIARLNKKWHLLTYQGKYEVVGEEGDSLSPPVTLCEPCKKLMHNPPHPRKLMQYDEGWVPFHTSLACLIDCCYSSRGCCRLCQIIWCGLLRAVRERRLQRPAGFIRACRQHLDWFSDDDLKAALSSHPNGYNLVLNLCIAHEPEHDSLHDFNISVMTDHTIEQHATNGDRLRLSDSTEATETFMQIKSWLKTCRLGHEACRPLPSHRGCPTRLIRIHDNGTTFHLEEQLGDNVEYIAVSYRWGSAVNTEPTYMLTSHTIIEMKGGVSISKLPRTLRDACKITKGLNYAYLWIDRLCIIQDSNQDWQSESARMGAVYMNAVCTIAASCAAGEDSGCFRTRNPAGLQPLRLKRCPLYPAKNVDEKGRGILELLRQLNEDDGIFDFGTSDDEKPTASPIKPNLPNVEINSWSSLGDGQQRLGHLEGRGWIYQEWLLSTRIVHFAEEQVFWDCRHMEASETYPDGHNWSAVRGETRVRPTIIATTSHAWDDMSTLKKWHNIVESYSHRQLTYTSDRLPAIGGLARIMGQSASDELGPYVAGLWKHKVLQGLCWQVDSGTAGRSTLDKNVGPSWSWASANTGIRYVDVADADDDQVFEPKKTFADFKDVKLDSGTSPNQYGLIRQGWMVLSGYLMSVKLQITDHGFNSYGARVHPLVGIRGPHSHRAEAVMDFSVPWQSPHVPEVFCLPLLTNDEQVSLIRVFCLLLVREELPQGHSSLASRYHTLCVYQRVGFWEVEMTQSEYDGLLTWMQESEKCPIFIQ